MKKYVLTPEHRAQLQPWAEKWIANALSTEPMTDKDKEICRKAVIGMYAAANLPKPNIVFVPSPFVARFATGFASAIWHLRKEKVATYAATLSATDAATLSATDAATLSATDAATLSATRSATLSATDAATYAATDAATYAATWSATRSATRSATDAATDAATRFATRSATDAATYAATYAATRSATDAATYAATDAATYAATYAATLSATRFATRFATDAATRSATYAATDAATRSATRFAWIQFPTQIMTILSNSLKLGAFGLMCAKYADRMWQGGNQWSPYDSYLSFFRHIAKLPLDYNKWDHWEQLSLHSSVRFVHEKFCIISDRPEVLKTNSLNQPHCEDGPFCKWRDGAALYAVNGVRMPMKYVLAREEDIDPKDVVKETNVEVRRELIRKIGIERFIQEAGAKVLNKQGDYELLSVYLSEDVPDARMLKMLNPSIGVWHVEEVAPHISTVQEALKWRAGEILEENEIWEPAQLT